MHFLLSLISPGIVVISRMVPSSSSAGMGGPLSGSRTLKIDEIGRSKNPLDGAFRPAAFWLSFPDWSLEGSAVALRERNHEISR